MVQGHVDGTGEIVEKWREGDSLWVRVKAPSDIMPYIVTKGWVHGAVRRITLCCRLLIPGMLAIDRRASCHSASLV